MRRIPTAATAMAWGRSPDEPRDEPSRSPIGSTAMGWLLGLLALVAPRFVLVLLWLFTDYLASAFHSFVWPLLGFILAPATTLG
jgi:hypothetical protein